MKIFKRDPADIISLANFTNHSQWSTTGSHLPINFPSVVLVSGCPITSNNGHPRAIYRVCVRHECLQTERSSKQRSWLGRDLHVFNIDPPTLALALCATWYRRSNRLPKENSRKRCGVGSCARTDPFYHPFDEDIWRALKLKLAEWRKKKKKKYPLEIRCTFVVYKRRRFKTLNFLSLTILLSASPMVLPPSQQFRNIIRTTIRGARSRSRRVNTRNVRIWVWLDTVHATHRFKEKLERKVEASEFKSHFRDIYLIRIHSESTIKTMNFRI